MENDQIIMLGHDSLPQVRKKPSLNRTLLRTDPGVPPNCNVTRETSAPQDVACWTVEGGILLNYFDEGKRAESRQTSIEDMSRADQLGHPLLSNPPLR
jgi:hypothetical protein